MNRAFSLLFDAEGSALVSFGKEKGNEMLAGDRNLAAKVKKDGR